MGTSLSGLTPATTFDGLLKVGDNDPLTADLKAISDGSGNDSAIQLSTGELKVLGQFNLDSDTSLTTMNLRGDSLVINQIYQANETTYNSIAMLNSAGIQFKNLTNTTAVIRSNKFGLGIGGSTIPSATAHIKGSGADDTTTSLLVQNSAGTELFKVQDDGRVDFASLYASGTGIYGANPNFKIIINSGENIYSTYANHIFNTYDGTGYNEAMRIVGNGVSPSVGIGETTPTARLHVKGSGNDNTTASLLVQNSDGTELIKVTDDGFINVRQSLIVKHSSFSSRNLRLGWGSIFADDNSAELSIGAVYSQTTAPRIILGGKIRASGADAIQVQTLNGMYIAPTASAEDPSAQLHIKGSGNDATTTALLVQNSDGANLFKVDDSGIGFYVNNDEASKLRFYASGGIGIINGGRNVRIQSGGGNALNITGSGTNGVVIGTTETNLASNVSLAVKGLAPVEDPPGTFSNPTALLVQNSDGDDLLKVTHDGVFSIKSLLNTNTLLLDAGIPVLNMQSSGADRFKIEATGSSVRIRTATAEGFNFSKKTIVSPSRFDFASAQLHVKSEAPVEDPPESGTFTNPTALLVENSAGTDLLKVRDDGRIVTGKGATTNANGTFNVLHGITDTVTRVFTVSRDSVLRGMDINSGGATKISDSSGDQSFSHTASAVLEVSSTAQGFLPPRMTEAQRLAINEVGEPPVSTPAIGLMVYQTDGDEAGEGPWVYTSFGWKKIQLM
jgi:hypothetical protein